MKKGFLTIVIALLLSITFGLAAGYIVNDRDRRFLGDVEMTAEASSYPTNVEYISVSWINNSDRSLTFGDSFNVEKKCGAVWRKLKLKQSGFYAIGYILLPDSVQNHKYQVKSAYGKLGAGEYRIATHYFASGNTYWLYAKFVVSNKL